MQDANMFGRPGTIAKSPYFLIHFKGETWGEYSLDDSKLLDGLAYEAGVPVSGIDKFLIANADEVVVIESSAQKFEHKLRDFPAVKKLLGVL